MFSATPSNVAMVTSTHLNKLHQNIAALMTGFCSSWYRLIKHACHVNRYAYTGAEQANVA